MFRPQPPPHTINVVHQPLKFAPNQTIETTTKEKSLYDKSIDIKKKLNQYQPFIPKAKFNKLWRMVSEDPFFDLDEELAKIKTKRRKVKGGSLDEDLYDFGEQKVGTKQAPPKPVKVKKPRKQARRITVAEYNEIHDKWTMCEDENNYLQKYIRGLEKLIKRLQK